LHRGAWGGIPLLPFQPSQIKRQFYFTSFNYQLQLLLKSLGFYYFFLCFIYCIWLKNISVSTSNAHIPHTYMACSFCAFEFFMWQSSRNVINTILLPHFLGVSPYCCLWLSCIYKNNAEEEEYLLHWRSIEWIFRGIINFHATRSFQQFSFRTEIYLRRLASKDVC